VDQRDKTTREFITYPAVVRILTCIQGCSRKDWPAALQ